MRPLTFAVGLAALFGSGCLMQTGRQKVLQLIAPVAVLLGGMVLLPPAFADSPAEFFERRVRPVLVTHCDRCHSRQLAEPRGGLRLDLKRGWQQGGRSGRPAVVPGEPDKSLLLLAVRHASGAAAMPPDRPALPPQSIADLTTWITQGAFDPRDADQPEVERSPEWETDYQARLNWWSLRPIANPALPAVHRGDWPRTTLDRFVLARLEREGLSPAPALDSRSLVRRLSFALTGLPPDPGVVEQFASAPTEEAWQALIEQGLASPQFGERWARHWMDVVHYADTHGYEWDVPAKGAWRYRDYLVRAFNGDLPYPRFVLEQLAGDLIEPRFEPATGINESLLGPLMLRLGERRHGDSAAAPGVAEEAVSNIIDTVGKAFLGTTLACAQCHDHKLDPIEQRDYYALAGVFMSTRFPARTLEQTTARESVLKQLRNQKSAVRQALARLWLAATDPARVVPAPDPAQPVSDPEAKSQPAVPTVAQKLANLPTPEKPDVAFPSTLAGFAFRARANTPVSAEDFANQRQARDQANSKVRVLARFDEQGAERGWRWEGLGLESGLVCPGEPVVSDEGEDALWHLLPGGRFSHVWSPRLAGSVTSPAFDPLLPVTFSVEWLAGKWASHSFIVDRALNSERAQYANRPKLGWQTFTAGRFDTLEGSVDSVPRRVYFELSTKSLNNYYPARVGYGGLPESELTDYRSWLGVTRIVVHEPGQPPQDSLARFEPLFGPLAEEADWPTRLQRLVRGAVERWRDNVCSDQDVLLLNDALASQLLPQELSGDSSLRAVVEQYRGLERQLTPEATAGSVDDWLEGRNERLALRGSYTDFGPEVERGGPRFLGGPRQRRADSSSGRLELAEQIVDPANPLWARVYVNRVWHYLLGSGMVRTPDDFGHLGETPQHPELLDHLATGFMQSGGSTKWLIRQIVGSSLYRQGHHPDATAWERDPENRWWHSLPRRRLEAEVVRDSLLWVSGRLRETLYGEPVEPHRTAEDDQKRLFRGPLDGSGRRSLYQEMTLMEPPRFLALFNQPLPKSTVGRRDVTNVPDQALALLNDPFVVDLARSWGETVARQPGTPCERAELMLTRALGRPPRMAELVRLVALIEQSSQPDDPAAGWKAAAHTLFNVKEFLYAP